MVGERKSHGRVGTYDLSIRVAFGYFVYSTPCCRMDIRKARGGHFGHDDKASTRIRLRRATEGPMIKICGQEESVRELLAVEVKHPFCVCREVDDVAQRFGRVRGSR